MTGIRIGIALGSGAARGWAHIGILRELRRLGLEPDIVCGTSIGAMVGAAYAGGTLNALEHKARTLTKLRLTGLFDFQFSHGGILAGRRLSQFIEEVVGDSLIEDLPKRFAGVGTDLDSGTEVWLHTGRTVEAVRASCALPGLIPAVLRDGRWLLDGALVNPVPVSVCRAMGADLVIAVNLNADVLEPVRSQEQEEADQTALGKWMANLPGADFFRQVSSHQKDEPSILTVMTQAMNIVQDRICRSRLAGDPPDVLLTPRLGDIGILQFDRADECIRRGVESVDQVRPTVDRLLSRLNRTGREPGPQ